MNFIADTEKDAIQVSRDLQYLENDGHPSIVCGPLAMAILRDAGLVDLDVNLHDFWLLNPRDPTDQQALEAIFPPTEYYSYTTTIPINQFSFEGFPLEPGDFVYLFAGMTGTFEHVIVVTRVDGNGRTFSVTNVNTEQGFIIQQVLLYDPNQPGEGMFYQWTDPDNIDLGLTGSGGFILWRRRK
jgi:hypothetical protein